MTARPRVSDYVLLIIGVIASASSALFIKASQDQIPPTVLSAGRLLLAAAFLTPVWWLAVRKRGFFAWNDLKIALPGAFFLCVHFITWIIGVRMTGAASATLIVNLCPVLMPFAVWIVMREKIVFGEAVGSAIAIAGVVVLTSTGQSEGNSWQGDALCAFSLVFIVAYMLCARIWAKGHSIWLYVVPLYWLAGLMTAPIAALEIGQAQWTTHSVLMLLGLTLIPTVIGHSITNIAMVRLPSQTVSTFGVLQFIPAAFMAWVLLSEVPAVTFYIASVLVVAGALIVVRSATPQVRESIEQATAEAG